jgi:hypothetical protein
VRFRSARDVSVIPAAHDARRISAGAAQYLERHAVSEIGLADAVVGSYRAVLVVPAFREPPGMLQGYVRAALGARGRVLVVVVVNAAVSAARETWSMHRELLADLVGEHAERVSSAPPAWLGRHAAFDVLAIDRASPGHCFPDKQGVGLARRIGCDLGLALYARGQIERPYLFCTDADAALPSDYFEVAPEAAAAAIVFSFWHEPGGDARIDAATAVYELGLRYYVAGLAHARSPYAFHAIGSAMAVDANAYAAVRGFPKRLSGEDFYLLGKVAKLGPICRADDTCIRLASRASARTVHGTGVAAVKIAAELDSGTTLFYHPQCFSLLGAWLEAVEHFALQRDVASARAALATTCEHAWPLLEDVLNELGAWDALASAARETRAPTALRARLHTWFDGFRTLKLIHGLRRRGLASIAYREALAAPWCPCAREAAHAPVDELRRAMAARLAREALCQGVMATVETSTGHPLGG